MPPAWVAVTVLLCCLFATETGADPGATATDPAVVFAVQGEAILTQGEMDAALAGIPEAQRAAFVRDGAKMDQLVGSLMRRKLVAADAAKAGFDKDPLTAERVRLAGEKALAEAWIEDLAARAPVADFEALAREDYLVNPDRYRGEVVIDVSHILIGLEGRTPAEAETLAISLHGWLEVNPARFDELVAEYSDDPSKGDNNGRFQDVRKGQMVPAFEKAAFAMTEPGAISGPVRSQFGYHLIRLNARGGGEVLPWEEVREQAIERARLEYGAAYRDRYLRQVTAGTIEIPEGAVERLVRRYLGDDFVPETPPEG